MSTKMLQKIKNFYDNDTYRERIQNIPELYILVKALYHYLASKHKLSDLPFFMDVDFKDLEKDTND